MTFDTRPLRSVLFLPASNPRAIEKVRTLPCDAVVLDLEDAVAPEAKAAARQAAVEAVRQGGFGNRLVTIRVNPLDSAWGGEDFAAAAGSGADAIVVPKVDSVAQAEAAVAAASPKPIWAMIESPAAVIAAAAIAATDGVAALIAGNADLAKELHATPGPDRAPLLYTLSAIVVAARAAGRIALDGIHADIGDLDGVALTSRQGAAFGFHGRTIIHPSHIEGANRAYAPSTEAIETAAGLIAAHEAAAAEGKGVTTYRGKLVEVLHVAEARQVLAFAETIAGR